MRVLFDQGTPVPLQEALGDHEVSTAYERSWSTLKNGDLLDEKAVGVAVGRFASAHGLGHAYFLLCLLPNLAAHVIGIVTSCQSASSRCLYPFQRRVARGFDGPSITMIGYGASMQLESRTPGNVVPAAVATEEVA